MRSIRLSLIVYFVLLLAIGLGAVCALFYFTTAQTLEDKEESARQLYMKEYQNRCADARASLDKHLVQQARMLAARTGSSSVAYEPIMTLGALSAVISPQGHLNMPLWVGEGYHPWLAGAIYRARMRDVYIASRHEDPREDPYLDEIPDPRYFQLFRGDGTLMQSSASMGESRFDIDEDLRRSELFSERFDTVTVDGKSIRRVTFKGAVAKVRTPNVFIPGRHRFFFKNPAPPVRPTIIERSAPTFYLMSGTDLGPLQEELDGYALELRNNINDLRDETSASLGNLRNRLVWIGLITFAGLALGGFGLLCLGLRPLSKLSDAVSVISERDFQLRVGGKPLPSELQPIADRLQETLDQLHKAFSREKQAAADISHELRTPLAALLTNLEVALRKNRSPEQYRELLEECKASGQQMYQLVERLLALARLDAGAVRLRPQTVDVARLAEQCVTLVKPLAEEKRLSLRLHAPAPVALDADPDKVREVLTNLLHNAIEYNKPDGSIDLTVQRHNGHVEVAVRDTGIGINAEARQHIFERFYRSDPSRAADTPHAGLGLAIVKSYVDLMGGAIDVESSAAGSTFTVKLPAA